VYEKEKSEENYVLGFSYGAVIAFLSANIVRPKKIFLCSLSARFKEDVSAMKPWIRRYQGKRRIAESLKTSGREAAKNLKIPSVVFCGEVESKLYPQLLVRCKETAKLAAKSKLVIVENAPHKIDYPTYQVAITKELQTL
jgi:dienelactone hydrolase